jgi:muramoyltetrapeptide carboxypeptidase
MRKVMPVLPTCLKKGDTIGVIAPSEPITSERMEGVKSGISLLGEMGLKLELSKNFTSSEYYMAGTAHDRASDFNEFVRRQDIKAIWTGWGGKSANQILEYIEWDALRENPKIVTGFSDTTNIINAVYAKTGLITFHGPHVIGKLDKLSVNSFNNIKRVFFEGLTEINIDNLPVTVLRDGITSGRLVGGNLKSFILANLNTQYEPELEGSIFFWETGSGTPQEIDHFLTYLRISGVFERVSGMLVGDLTNCKDKRDWGGRDIDDVIISCCDGFSFPIARIDTFGHNDTHNTILPIGVEANIDTASLRVEVIDQCICMQ